MRKKKKPKGLNRKKLLDNLSYAIYLLVEDEGHSDWFIQELLDLNDEQYNFVKNYGGYCDNNEE